MEGPPARNVASSQATTNTKSLRLGRLRNDARRSDLDRAPAFIGEIEVDVAGMFGEANMNRPFETIKLGVRLEQIEG